MRDVMPEQSKEGERTSTGDMQISDFNAFYRWNSGHLLENRTRGAFAEWLVHRALNINSEFREEWAPVDATYKGITIEIKSAAYEQSWPQERPSSIVFSMRQKVSDVYVFCLMRGKTPEDLDHWDFWVVPTEALTDQHSISLNPLKELFGDPVPFTELKPLIEAQCAGATR